MSEKSLTHTTLRTSLWAGVEKFSTMGVSFVISILIARKLTAEDYGIVAMLSIFIEMAASIMQSGFGNALIRKQDCKSIDYSTAFYFNLAVSILMYLLLFISSPYIASFYNLPLLSTVLRVSGISLIVQALTFVQYTILIKELEAKKQAKIAIISSLTSGFIGILLAYSGFGVWSLVFQQLTVGFVNFVLLWWSSTWYPRIEFSRFSIKYLWGFGSKMLLTGIISVFYRNIYSLVIGRYYMSSSLGLFNRGQSFALQIPNVLDAILVKNTLPIFSQIQDDKERLVRIYREYIKLSCFICIPVVCLLSVLAQPLVSVLLTDKWLDCVVYIKIFALTSFLLPANNINLNLLQVYGRSDYVLYAECIKKSIGISLVFILVPYGPTILAIGSSMFNVFAYIVNLSFAKRISGLKIKVQIKDIFPIILSAIFMYIVVYLFINCINNNILKIVFGLLGGSVFFIIITKFIFKLSSFEYLKYLKKRKLHNE